MSNLTEATKRLTCGARAGEVGGPADWLCILTPQHYPNRLHQTAAGEKWGTGASFVPGADEGCTGSALPGEAVTCGRSRPCPDHDGADELETAALVADVGDPLAAGWSDGLDAEVTDGSPGDLLPSDPPVQATLSDVVRALAEALEVLPEPIGWSWNKHSGSGLGVHVDGMDRLEEWARWWGAAPTVTGDWRASGARLMYREHSAVAERGGQTVRLFAGEFAQADVGGGESS